MAAFFAPFVSTSPICDTTFYTTGLTQLDLEKDLAFFPNPASESFTIRQLTFEKAEYFVLDNQGRIIQKGELKMGDNPIDLSNNLMSGLYFIKVSSEGVAAVKTINFRKN